MAISSVGHWGQAALSLAVMPGTLCNAARYESHLSAHLGHLSKPTQREGAGATNTSSPHLHPQQRPHYPRAVISLPAALLSHLSPSA